MTQPLITIFFIPSFGNGGAEMNLVRLLNTFDRGRIKPILALAKPGGGYEKELAKDVEIIYLTSGKIPSSTGRLVASILPLRRLAKRQKADVVFASLDPANIAALLSTVGMRDVARIVSVHNTPSVQYSGTYNVFGKVIIFLLKRLYRQATAILAISKGVAADLKQMLPRHTHNKLRIVHNPGFDARTLRLSRVRPIENYPQKVPIVVACGRLVEQKSFAVLIEAFCRVRQQTKASLLILGEGYQRPALEAQIRRLALEDSVRLLGFQDNPYQYMAAADVFVLSSIFEGFGNVLVEAMACGTAVISTDCPHGPAEIITPEVNGLLTPVSDAKALAQSILRLLADDALRLRLAKAGQRRSHDFDVAKIASQYMGLFESAAADIKVRSSLEAGLKV